MTRLNGWRRIGVVLTLTWLIGCVAIIFYEDHYSEQFIKGGLFVWRAPPMGTTFNMETLEITLPDNRTIPLADGDGALHPSEINWAMYKDIATDTVYDDKIKTALGFPFLAWVLVEIIVLVMRWIAKGFPQGKAP